MSMNEHNATPCAGITATGQGPGRMLVHVQEICAYSTDTRFTGAAGIDEQVALLQLRMAPRATVRSAGLLSRGASVLVSHGPATAVMQLSGQDCGRPAHCSAQPPPQKPRPLRSAVRPVEVLSRLITMIPASDPASLAQVELVGSAVLRLVAHGEDYFIQLPNLLLEDPLSPAACQPTLTGATPTVTANERWSCAAQLLHHACTPFGFAATLLQPSHSNEATA